MEQSAINDREIAAIEEFSATRGGCWTRSARSSSAGKVIEEF